MKKLTLQLDKKTFDAIKSGELTTLIRDVYPNNCDRYVYRHDFNDPQTGEALVELLPLEFEALILKTGRGDNAEKMEVEIKSAEFSVLTDDEGNDLTYTEDGEEYYFCQVEYALGEVKVYD